MVVHAATEPSLAECLGAVHGVIRNGQWQLQMVHRSVLSNCEAPCTQLSRHSCGMRSAATCMLNAVPDHEC
jgi:hypothetical protein